MHLEILPIRNSILPILFAFPLMALPTSPGEPRRPLPEIRVDQSRRTASTTPGDPRRPVPEDRVDQPALVAAWMKGNLKRMGRNGKGMPRIEQRGLESRNSLSVQDSYSQ